MTSNQGMATVMDTWNEKHTIKNLLFTKIIPNYVIPVPLNGHKIYGCIDCGDKFVFESSYNDHVSRKSVKITYLCKHCGTTKVFFNRCNLLYHIRSHAFKTATINVTDLKIEPLPISELSISNIQLKPIQNSAPAASTPNSSNRCICRECKQNITITGIVHKDRASHLMKFTNEVHSCPVCFFALPSICGIKTHLRLHLKVPPYFCPECGVHLANKNVTYPYNHDCEGFKMMRVTARVRCILQDCPNIFHHNDFRDHMKENHLKKVFKCPFCVVACFNETTMQKHLCGHRYDKEPNVLVFFQCEACPGRFVMRNHVEQHLKSHVAIDDSFPCWVCGISFKEVTPLLHHQIKEHEFSDKLRNAITEVLDENTQPNINKTKRIYRVVKKCDQCQRNFTYKCQYEEISVLPIECPYKCSVPLQTDISLDSSQSSTSNKHIKCLFCGDNIVEDWKIIKKHYAVRHKTIKCLDVEVHLTKINVDKYIKQSVNKKLNLKKVTKRRKNREHNKMVSTIEINTTVSTEHDVICNICKNTFGNNDLLQEHIISHRDPCMAYQCMECGQSFVVKPTFSKHLLLEHDITNTDDYIEEKQCYNENALLKYQDVAVISNEPLADNQCTICREQFNSAEDLDKHFRVHGMAFLKMNASNKNPT